MNKKTIFIAGAALVAILGAAWAFSETGAFGSDTDAITMYKNQGCQCCDKWATYLEDEGFEVSSETPQNLDAFKKEHGVPYQLSSCHTAVVGDYIVEGHVPADDIKRMLNDQPDAIGIAVPGMPIGSPGMEQGNQYEEYDVILFEEDGGQSVYASH